MHIIVEKQANHDCNYYVFKKVLSGTIIYVVGPLIGVPLITTSLS